MGDFYASSEDESSSHSDSEYSDDCGDNYDAPMPSMQQQRQSSRAHLTSENSFSLTALGIALANPHDEAALRKAHLLDVPEKHSVTFHFAQSVPLNVLKKQLDGGKRLRLTRENGFTMSFSHPEDDKKMDPAVGPVDVLVGTHKVWLKNSLGLPLLLTLSSVPLSAGHATADKSSIDKELRPHGALSFILQANGKEEILERGLSKDQMSILNLYPAESNNKISTMKYPVAAAADWYHVRIGTPVQYFYNNLKEVKENPELAITKGDQFGLAYGRKDLVDKAADIYHKLRTHRNPVCNLTDGSVIEAYISLVPENKRVGDNVPGRDEQKGIAAYMKERIDASKKKINETEARFNFQGEAKLEYFPSVVSTSLAGRAKAALAAAATEGKTMSKKR